MRGFEIGAIVVAAVIMAGGGAVAGAAEPAAAAETQAVAEADGVMAKRADDLVAVLNGKAAPAAAFAPELIEKVTEARLLKMAATIRARQGEALGVGRIESTGAHSGTVYVNFADTQFPVELQLDPDAPHLIVALKI